MDYTQRQILTRWRCRSNYLPISASRFYPEDDFTCPLCRTDSIGNEEHYLMSCPFFLLERQNLIENQPNFLNMFRSNNKIWLSKLTRFLDIILRVFDHRNEWDRDLNDSSILFVPDEDDDV